uniref:Uncharacterized protein n=1 Tax=Plectus sambesii TaxID=2011161 RepID=A0A914XS97_9BILA
MKKTFKRERSGNRRPPTAAAVDDPPDFAVSSGRLPTAVAFCPARPRQVARPNRRLQVINGAFPAGLSVLVSIPAWLLAICAFLTPNGRK